jgi:hypothetical protein
MPSAYAKKDWEKIQEEKVLNIFDQIILCRKIEIMPNVLDS